MYQFRSPCLPPHSVRRCSSYLRPHLYRPLLFTRITNDSLIGLGAVAAYLCNLGYVEYKHRSTPAGGLAITGRLAESIAMKSAIRRFSSTSSHHCKTEISATCRNSSRNLFSIVSRFMRTVCSSAITITLSKNASTGSRNAASSTSAS